MAKSILSIDEDEKLPYTHNIGLNGPDGYVLPAFSVWIRSGLVVYPNGKSYDDQLQWLLDDFQFLMWRYSHHINRLKPKT